MPLNAQTRSILLNAVPSFESEWREMERDWGADESGAAADFPLRLGWYVGEQVARGQTTELEWLFGAMETLYDGASAHLESALTVGLLENLINAVEEQGGNAAGIATHLAGSRTSEAWRAAWFSTHPERSGHQNHVV